MLLYRASTWLEAFSGRLSQASNGDGGSAENAARSAKAVLRSCRRRRAGWRSGAPSRAPAASRLRCRCRGLPGSEPERFGSRSPPHGPCRRPCRADRSDPGIGGGTGVLRTTWRAFPCRRPKSWCASSFGQTRAAACQKPGETVCPTIFDTVSRSIPKRRTASRWLIPSRSNAMRTFEYSSTPYILPPITIVTRDLPLAGFYAVPTRMIRAIPWQVMQTLVLG